jgi:hypothetical protein
MTKIKYCCDCGHYIPGGRERNCTVHPYSKDSVSALKEACSKFVEREERPKETFAPITYKLRRTRRKSYEITK